MKVTAEMIAAGLAAKVRDYRAERREEEIVSVEEAMHTYGFHHPIDGGEMVQAILEAAFAAQPSPAGQGDALEAIDARFRSGNQVPVDRAAVPREEWDALKSALAARQPVVREPIALPHAADNSISLTVHMMAGQPVGQAIAHRVHYTDGVTGKEISVSPWMDGDAAEFNVIYAAEQPRTRWIENAYAAPPTQAVGQEPVTDSGRTFAYDVIDRFLRNNLDDATYAEYAEHLEALWAAVPAQVVDLGQFREAVSAWWSECSRKRMNSIGGPAHIQDYAELACKEADRLLALIDSHQTG